MGQRLIITEEEKNRIQFLYESMGVAFGNEMNGLKVKKEETTEDKKIEPEMYLGIGDHGFYDEMDRPVKDFDFDYDEEEYDDFDEFISKYPNQIWFRKGRSDDAEFNRDSSDRKYWESYKKIFGGPFKLRKRKM